MHYTILIISLIFSGSAFAESSLPPCEGEEYKQWVNCYGSYQKKSESNGKTFVRNYSGEFGNLPGKRAGKGKSQVSQNGKLAFEYNGFFENDTSIMEACIAYKIFNYNNFSYLRLSKNLLIRGIIVFQTILHV